MATNLAVVGSAQASGIAISGVRIESMADVWRLADALAQARGFIPAKLIGQPGSIAAAILMGIELGMMPMEALRSLHVVDGKPQLAADAMLARAIRAGVRHTWEQSDEKEARLRLERTGFTPYVQRWTIEDAKRAKLDGKDNWRGYAASMLRARCVSSAMRAFCPDVLGSGVYVEGEIEESAPGSSGSPEVRVLGAAVHEADEVDPSEPDDLGHAMYALHHCRTDGDLRTWIATFSERVEREPQTTRKVERWKAIGLAGGRVTPPVRKAELVDLFRQAREKRAARDVTPEGVSSDGEVSPLQRAMDELHSCETREALIAWLDDNASAFVNIISGEKEREAWACIAARCETVGGIKVEELEQRLS